MTKRVGGPVVLFLLLPALVFFLLAIALPVVGVVALSFFKTNFITTQYVGCRNYVATFRDERFLAVLVNTLGYVVCIVPLQTVFSVLLAVLLDALPRQAQHFGRIAVYAPTLTAGIVIASAWKWIFHPTGGLVNWIIGLLGGEPVVWFSTRLTTIPTIAVIQVLTVTGSTAIIFCAAMRAISKDLLDAAKIDGAGGWETVWHIYLPIIAPTIALLVLIMTMGAMQIFEWVYMFAQHSGAITFMYNIYSEGFKYSRFGTAAAQSVVLIGIIGVLAGTQRRLQRWQST